VSTKRIFLPICRQDLDMSALEAGVVVARKFGAHLEGVYIQAPHAPSAEFAASHLDPRHYTEVVNRLQKQKQQDVVALRQAFEQFVTSRSLALSSDPLETTLATASWEEISGDPDEVVAMRGGAFDLIVISYPALGPAATPSSVLEAAIFSTARPVLLAHEDVPARLGRSIMIAWNRGIQSRRAVTAAMPFLETAESAVIVNIATGAKQGPEAEEIARTLSWHGVKAEAKRLPPDRRSVGETLLEEVRETGADLLVMGAYSEHRLRERLIGGVTKEILAKADFPILMAR
jgi:nucleotide-binding universal stress UspA family protein